MGKKCEMSTGRGSEMSVVCSFRVGGCVVGPTVEVPSSSSECQDNADGRFLVFFLV